MNLTDFYANSEQRLIDSILSLWATGDSDTQSYLKHIFLEEKLLAEPVIQTTFPWESIGPKDVDLRAIFNKPFVDAFTPLKEKEYRFPDSPYKHQVESWKALLQENKSIVVTTGTGSGKTECFMLPVLFDIYSNSRNSSGVNAIFLYPLNALISSQKKRVDAWTRCLKGINYAVYNGNTDEKHIPKDQNKKYPEIISRELIRTSPPQILFTNPTMLEYILLRNKDSELLNNSKGKLRWILLDEAHTLTGSAAAEIALLIRRVIDAFEVDLKDVRFVATSATVGSRDDEYLANYMSRLTGKRQNDIKIIKGRRILPKFNPPTIKTCTFTDIQESSNDERMRFKPIHDLQKKILEKDALKVSEIAKPFKLQNIDKQLQLVDILADTVIDNKAIFPVRGHFFTRGIGGTFVCTNPDCNKHAPYKPISVIGTMTTFATVNCNFCGYPLLELVACHSCGKFMLSGEQYTNAVTHKDFIQLSSNSIQDAFYVESEIEETDEGGQNNQNVISKKELFITRYKPNNRYISGDHTVRYKISNDSEIITDSVTGDFISAEVNGSPVCPHCGENTISPMHFRLSSTLANRVLADIILEQTPEATEIFQDTLWSGHKYLSFTDSRQGTAKISALINIDSEKNWIRSQLYHSLAKRRNQIQINEYAGVNEDEIRRAIQVLEDELLTCLPILKKSKSDDLQRLREALNPRQIPSITLSRMTFAEANEALIINSELGTLLNNMRRTDDGNEYSIELYLKAIFFDQFARRLPRERSLENLGLVNIIYPSLEQVKVPGIVKGMGISEPEWQDLLKIATDYIIRSGFHFFLPPNIRNLITTYTKSITIYPFESEVINAKKWPHFDRTKLRQNRLCLLICAGLGYHNLDDISPEIEDQINELLQQIWRALVSRLLQPDGPTGGYKLNIEEKFVFELAEDLWLCPAKSRLIDRQFRGYSPWISGNLTEDNIFQFKVSEKITFPFFNYPFNKDEDGNTVPEKTKEWINENSGNLKDHGIWNNLHERIIQTKPLFLAGEHSAQQPESRLKTLESNFEEGKINILSCSTTMEMGVDIGGISAVVMNNVPPRPANYLQRAGRAGRRSETKSLALTFCASNPIGSSAMSDPLWALNHKIAPPVISFNSASMAERHLNAFFFGKFVRLQGGMSIKENVEGLFFSPNNNFSSEFESYLQILDSNAHENSVRLLLSQTPLENRSMNFLLNLTWDNFERIKSITLSKKNDFIETLNGLIKDSPAWKSVNYQFRQFRVKPVIAYLADQGFLPSAGLPTGVVNFDTISIEDLKRIDKADKQGKEDYLLNKPTPSHHITRALSEFAPGNNIVIDGWNYVSAGIILKSQWDESKRDIIQACTRCGYQTVLEIGQQHNISSTCPHCNSNSLKGLIFKDANQGLFTEVIQPAGFAVDLYSSTTRRINEASSVQYVEPLLISIPPWSDDHVCIYNIRKSLKNGEILYYNMGYGNGYSVCLHCGRTASNPTDLEGHARLRGGQGQNAGVCSGNGQYGIKDNVILGGRFQTDFCEIIFQDSQGQYSNDEATLYSLGVVLTKTLTSFLGIQEDELSFGVKRYERFRSLFIFDTAKGGSDYSIKFSDYAEEIFKEALHKLTGCDCEKACTKCLIDRSSQWHIQKLDRTKAIEWLERAVNNTVPPEYKAIYPDLKFVLGPIKEDIIRKIQRREINNIWFFIDHITDQWDLDQARFITDFKKRLEKINLVIHKPLEYSNNEQNLISAIQVSSWANFLIDNKHYQGLYPVCQVQLNDGNFIIYFSDAFNNSFSDKWGSSTNGYFLTTKMADFFNFKNHELALPQGNIRDVYLKPVEIFNINSLAKLFLKEADGLKGLMNNQNFKITYTDRYLNSPFSCLVFIKFIVGLQRECNFSIISLTLNLQAFTEQRQPYMIYDNYYGSEDRDEELMEIASNNDIEDIEIKKAKQPHYRILEFSGPNTKIIIRPDGGIEHGWHTVGHMLYKGLTGEENINIRRGVDYPILYSIITTKN